MPATTISTNNVNEATSNNVKGNSAAPLNDSRKMKIRERPNKEKQARAAEVEKEKQEAAGLKMPTSTQKQRQNRAIPPPQARPFFEQTGLVIASDCMATNSSLFIDTAHNGAPATEDNKVTPVRPASATISSTSPTPQVDDQARILSPPSGTGSTFISDPYEHSGSTLSFDDDKDLELQPANDNPSWRALKIKEELETCRMAQVIQADKKLRKKIPVKKGRVPLTTTAKKDHNKPRIPLETLDQLLSQKQPRVPPRSSENVMPISSVSPVISTPPGHAASLHTPNVEYLEVPIIDTSLDFFKLDERFDSAMINCDMDMGAENYAEIYASGPALWVIMNNTTKQLDNDAVTETPMVSESLPFFVNATDAAADFNEETFTDDVAAGMPNFDGNIKKISKTNFTDHTEVGDEQTDAVEMNDDAVTIDGVSTYVYEDENVMEGSNNTFETTIWDAIIPVEEVVSPSAEYTHQQAIKQAQVVDEKSIEHAETSSVERFSEQVSEIDATTEPITEQHETESLVHIIAPMVPIMTVKDTSDIVPTSKDTDEQEIGDDITAPSEDCLIEKPINPTADKSACELDFLLFCDAAQYPFRLSRDEELELITEQVGPFRLPVAPTKPTCTEKKATKKLVVIASIPEEKITHTVGESLTEQDTTPLLPSLDNTADPTEDVSPPSNEAPAIAAEDLIPLIFDTPMQQNTTLSDEPAITTSDQMGEVPATVKDGYITGFLAMPNGSGYDSAIRKLNEDLVVLHVAPFVEPPTQVCKQNKKAKETQKTAGAIIPKVLEDNFAMKPTEPEIEALTIEETSDTNDATVIEQAEVEEPVNTDTTTIEQPNSPISDSTSYKDTAPYSSPSSRSHPSTLNSSIPSTCHTSAINLDRKTHLARNTYLGITFLEDFIEALDFEESDGTTTKSDICNTFIALSSSEFETVQGRRPDVIEFGPDSVVMQRKIKLGRTSLYAFLRAVPFDHDDVTSVKHVMAAFRKAARGEDGASAKLKLALQFDD